MRKDISTLPPFGTSSTLAFFVGIITQESKCYMGQYTVICLTYSVIFAGTFGVRRDSLLPLVLFVNSLLVKALIIC